MSGRPDLIRLAEDALADEALAHEIYSMAAEMSKDEKVRARLLEIAEMERRHLDFWRSFLERRGRVPKSIGAGSIKVKLYAFLIRLLGLALTFKLMESGERDAITLYTSILGHPSLTDEERNEVKQILADELMHEHELAEEESRFMRLLSHVRDVVLGMHDGLVEILSVTAGLAGAYGDPFQVALSGLVVAIAGSLSMGIGAHAAAKSQKEVHEGVINRVRLAASYAAQFFKSRIKSLMLKKGYREEAAEIIASEASQNPNLLTKLVAEEEHGLREESVEEPTAAGLYTGIAYLLSSIIPITPYLIGLPTITSLAASILAAGAALAIIGLIIAISANLPIKKKIIEMILAGLGSAITTYIIGKAFSLALGITVE